MLEYMCSQLSDGESIEEIITRGARGGGVGGWAETAMVVRRLLVMAEGIERRRKRSPCANQGAHGHIPSSRVTPPETSLGWTVLRLHTASTYQLESILEAPTPRASHEGLFSLPPRSLVPSSLKHGTDEQRLACVRKLRSQQIENENVVSWGMHALPSLRLRLPVVAGVYVPLQHRQTLITCVHQLTKLQKVRSQADANDLRAPTYEAAKKAS